MKKLSLLLVVALIFTGCASKAKLTEFTTYPNSELLYHAPLNLDWGMSKDQAFKALGITADQAKLDVIDTSNLDGDVTIAGELSQDRDTYTAEVTCDGAEICVVLRFANQKHIDGYGADYGLISAEIAFNGDDVYNKVKESLSNHTTKSISVACEPAKITDEMLAFMNKRLDYTRSSDAQNNPDAKPIDPVQTFGKEPLAGASLEKGSGNPQQINGKDYDYMAFYRGLNAAFYNVTTKGK